MHTLANDLRYALRSIVRYRALTGAAVVCMVLGIGVSTTLFGSVNPWLFRPLPYPKPDRLVRLRETEPERGDRAGHTSDVSGPNYLDWRERSRSFAGMGAYDRTQLNLSIGDVPERIHAARITWTLFPTLQIQPVVGRGFTEEEDRPRGPRVALISHRLWQQRFDSDPAVTGRTLMLDGAPHAIVGVMPPVFAFPEYAEAGRRSACGPTPRVTSAASRSWRASPTASRRSAPRASSPRSPRLSPGSTRTRTKAAGRGPTRCWRC